MKDNEAIEKREVRTSYLVFDWDATDWALFQRMGCLVRYKIPYKQKNDYDYYPRMHNLYKNQSDFPCYLHIYGPFLYVMYPSAGEIKEIKINGSPLNYEKVQLGNKDVFHAIVKVLLSDYFLRDQKFVSNAHFFLRSSSADKDFVTGLSIGISQNWRHPEEFAVKDNATRLRKLQISEMTDDRNWLKQLHYGRIHQDGMTIFKQLKPNGITQEQKNDGIYVEYRNKEHKANITFHSVSSLAALEETRSYLLNYLLSKLIDHFRGYGLHLRQKTLGMEKMSNLNGKQMEPRQIPIQLKKVFIVNDRWNQKDEKDTFLHELTSVANTIIQNDTNVFEEKSRDEIQDGDMVLRLQDYGEEDFSSEEGLLNGSADPKQDFYRSLPNVVKQTININPNTETRKQEKAKPKKGKQKKEPGIEWNLDQYFSYPVPGLKDKDFQIKLEVCYNQLILKDIVTYPENAIERLPQLKISTGKIFMVNGYLTYFDGRSLNFLAVKGNLENATCIIRDLTGKDLVEDVLVPSIKYSKPDPTIDRDEIERALKRPFIISNDCVLEIRDNDGRMLYEDLEIRDRFERIEEKIPTKLFYPKFPLTGNEPFTEHQLKDYSSFLDENVLEPFISFSDLKMKYGINLKDSSGSILIKGGGFYHLLGIQKDTKFRAYLNDSLGLKYES
jgi:hypothetical protein